MYPYKSDILHSGYRTHLPEFVGEMVDFNVHLPFEAIMASPDQKISHALACQIF